MRSAAAEINAVRDKTSADLNARPKNPEQISAVNNLLKDAIQKRAADVFMTEQRWPR